MSEWKTHRIGEVSALKYGENLPSPSLQPSGYPVYGANGIIGFYSRYNLDCPTVLVSCRGEYSGVLNLSAPQAFVTNNSIPLRLSSSGIDTKFLYYRLSLVPRSKMVSGSAQPQVTINDLKDIEVTAPPLPEQWKIARILTTVDHLIEQTEALIEKYKSIKQGMMHDLFTRGVDSTGQLRPPYEDAPELYKESPLGWIPKEWEVAVLGEEIGPITSGWSPTCDAETAAEGEWAILKTTAVVWDGYDDGENKRLPYHLQPLPKLEVVKNDILITRKGPVERVGVVVHVPETRSHMMIPDTVFRVRVETSSELLPAFVPLALGCEQVQTDWFGRKIGLADAQVNVNHGILRSTNLPKPNQDEQTAICTRMQAIQDTIDAEQAHVDDLASIKTGLMQDLLTGKVRVEVDEAEEVTADV